MGRRRCSSVRLCHHVKSRASCFILFVLSFWKSSGCFEFSVVKWLALLVSWKLEFWRGAYHDASSVAFVVHLHPLWPLPMADIISSPLPSQPALQHCCHLRRVLPLSSRCRQRSPPSAESSELSWRDSLLSLQSSASWVRDNTRSPSSPPPPPLGTTPMFVCASSSSLSSS